MWAKKQVAERVVLWVAKAAEAATQDGCDLVSVLDEMGVTS
jgi:hypothetical protein